MPEGKEYRSPIIDCRDGMLAAWNMATIRIRNWEIPCLAVQPALFHRAHIRFFIQAEAALAEGLAGSSGLAMRGSPDRYRGKDARHTIQPAKGAGG